jgi:hypothetical protein
LARLITDNASARAVPPPAAPLRQGQEGRQTGPFQIIAGAALVADAGRAQQSGRTSTITTLKTRGSVWIAGGGKAMRVGRLNPEIVC